MTSEQNYKYIKWWWAMEVKNGPSLVARWELC